MNSYPGILIFGQPFNNFSGGGITLTNLFKGWPDDKIAVTAIGHKMYNVDTSVCKTYFQIGKEEYKWRFPFSYIQRSFDSGLMVFRKEAEADLHKKKKGIRSLLVNKLFFPLMRWTGLFHCISRISLSDKLKEWLDIYRPEILYLQISTREEIRFASELIDYLKIPTAIHMMDDWPSTISSSGPFKKFWKNKIDREFRLLLDRIDIYLGISDAMTTEYMRRYNKKFIAFHNPIETEIWHSYQKASFELTSDHVKILYSGRIGVGIKESLVEVANIIDTINGNGDRIKLYIQSASNHAEFMGIFRNNDCVIVNPIVKYSDLPAVFSQADILVLANDFNKNSIDFLRYSMPTKASEYMISGTPVLVYAPYETAVSRFFDENECGYCVTENKPDNLANAILKLINDKELRKKLSYNAVKLATILFDANKVRSEFQKMFISQSET